MCESMKLSKMVVDTFYPAQVDQENSSPGNCKAICRNSFRKSHQLVARKWVDGKPLKNQLTIHRAHTALAIGELSMKEAHSIEDTVKATIDSYLELNMIYETVLLRVKLDFGSNGAEGFLAHKSSLKADSSNFLETER